MTSLAPWLWLVDFEERNRALDASSATTGELAAALMAHFAEVHVLRNDRANLDGLSAANRRDGLVPSSTALGSVRHALWPAETFDCIALHDTLVRRQLPITEVLVALRGAHRMLKRGGWLALASPRPSRLRRPPLQENGISRGVLSRLLSVAHFREVRCLFVEPSVDDPVTMVPDMKTAIRAHDAIEGARGIAMWRRRAAVELGLRSALFPAYVLLARA